MIEFPDLPKREQSAFEVTSPNLGIYVGFEPKDIPDRGVSDCMNVRLTQGKISNIRVGYEKFMTLGLGNQCLLIDDFIQTNSSSITIFGTKSDLFQYNSGSNEPKYITPRYVTGDATVSNGSANVAGVGSLWDTGTPKNAKAGDFIHFGSAAQVDVDAIWYEILSITNDTNLILTTTLAEATHTNVSYTIRKVFTATDSDFWNSDTFPDAPIGTTSSLAAGDHWFGTNGVELVVWDGIAGTVVVLSTQTTGLGFSCQTVTFYKNMMIYGRLVESGASKPGNAKNSAIADPENVTTLEANEFTFVEGIDFIEQIVPLGDFLVIYGRNSVAIAQFVSVPVFFAIRTVAPGIGIYSGRMVMDFGDYHEFLSTAMAYRFDGVRLQPFGNHVFPGVLKSADRSRASKSLVFISEEELEVMWVIALAADGDADDKSAEIAYTEYYAENVGRSPTPFMKRELPATASGSFVNSIVGRFNEFPGQGFDEVPFEFNNSFLTATFPVVLIGTEDGFIWRINTASRIGTSTTYLSSFTSPVRPLAGGDDVGIIRRIEPYVEKDESSGNLAVFAQTQDRASGEVSTDPFEVYDITHGGERFVHSRKSGRYGSVTFLTLVLDTPWTMSGYKVLAEKLGER